MFAAIAAAVDPNALAGGSGEFLDHGGRDRLLPHTLGHRMGAVGVGLGLIADRLKADDAFLERRIVQIGDAGLDCVIEPLQPQICFGRQLVQFGDMFAPALGPLLATVEDRGQHFFEAFGL